MSGKFFRARAVCRKSYSPYVVLSGVQKQKAVKLHAKIMDSGVSRIQMWREKKMQEKKEKRRAHYEKNREKIIAKVVEARKKKQATKSGRGRSERNKRASVKEVTKKNRRERNQQKRASEMNEKIEKGRRLARERSNRYRQKLKEQKEQNTQTQVEAEPMENSERTTPFANRMAKKQAVQRAKKNLPATPEKKAEVVASITKSPRTRKILEKRGLVKTPEEEKEVVVLKALASDLAEGIKAVKNDRSNKGRSALGAVKSLSFGQNVRKSRSQKTL